MAGRLAKIFEEYPLRDGNQLELLIDGDVFIPRMLAAIDTAQQSIYLEMYLFESGQVATQFIQALKRAAQRGVRVYVLLDAFGARGLQDADREQLSRVGIEMKFYNPLRWYPFSHWKKNIVRDHRKLLLIDNVCGFTGGAGITDLFVEHAGKPAWRESMLLIRGPILADCQWLFEKLWRWLGGKALDGAGRSQPPVAGELPVRLVTSYGFSGQAIYRSVKQAIGRTQRRLWLSTPYFIPSRRMRRALLRAARRGVDVRLLLPVQSDHPGVNLASQWHYTGLLKAGVQIYQYRSRVLHSKILLCDDWVSMGSSNYDRFTMRWNLDANLVIPSSEFADRVQEQFEVDFSHSDALSLSDWQRRRSIWLRLRQQFWAKIANFLDRLRRRH
jgi:phosphatidylserine/phosphatidylglycerophosphate/cardiolipin synthase-like enzyme